MKNKCLLFSFLLMIFGAFQPLIASNLAKDDTLEAICCSYLHRSHVRVLCCIVQSTEKNLRCIDCSTSLDVVQTALNISCCIPRCVEGCLCCCCFGCDLVSDGIQQERERNDRQVRQAIPQCEQMRNEDIQVQVIERNK